jgi:hypothetical protein
LKWLVVNLAARKELDPTNAGLAKHIAVGHFNPFSDREECLRISTDVDAVKPSGPTKACNSSIRRAFLPAWLVWLGNDPHASGGVPVYGSEDTWRLRGKERHEREPYPDLGVSSSWMIEGT